MNLSSEYDKLLDIIDKEKKKHKPKKEIQQKEESKSDNNIETYKNLDINDSSNNNNDISYNKNTEFSLDKLKRSMRKKLISSYYKYRNYERPLISVTEVISCIKKAYYFRMKYEVDDNNLFNYPQLLLIQECGKIIHEVVQSNFDFDICEKVIKSEKYKMKGKVDGIKSSTAFELKSLDPDEFKTIKKIRENDYNQGIVYCYLLNDEFDYKIDSLECVYISRNLKDIKVFKSDIDFEKAKIFTNKSLQLYDCLSKTTPPNIKYDKNNQECFYCEFKKYCKKNDTLDNNKINTLF